MSNAAAKQRSRARVGEIVVSVVRNELLRETGDFPVDGVVFTACDMAPDFSVATLRFTVHPGVDAASVAAALDERKGRLRQAVAKRVETRTIPALRFVYDRAGEARLRVDSILAELARERTDD